MKARWDMTPMLAFTVRVLRPTADPRTVEVLILDGPKWVGETTTASRIFLTPV